MSGRLLLIGIGCGDPEHLTLRAARAIAELDVLFVVTKGRGPDDELVGLRRELVRRHRPTGAPLREVELADPPRPWRTAPDYAEAVATWRAGRAALWRAALADIADGRTGGFLVWGDPSLYESTLAVVQEVREGLALELEVIPGVSSVHALTARHAIPLNRVGGAVQIMPARRLAAHGMPDGVDDVVVMLDPDCAFTALDPDGLDIHWGAFVGTPDELLLAGPLAQTGPRIVSARAAAKARKGWMFDLYLLRRR
ncbi:precorrin-6A synthase (deacetylating) [Paraconexibacter algicola]|uniref:Precorrin-6A synthase (Deacetylating) n=1 Tax=Paraconexibacter algicola TaxID=2133960 RepID=A0A2T4UJM0_9ACTN|nr:precorrin-6A synthase (deacetylating) [Paraconexibacter algicola]PTL59415.1 precorrin-6A synthase (deacetylating) [Paraconexibacter algicola]